MREPRFTPHLRIYENEGHGRYFEVYDGPASVRNELGGYAGTFATAGDICRTYAGRIALLFTYEDYDRECAARIALDPDGWDCSDVAPAPHLVTVRPAPMEVS